MRLLLRNMHLDGILRNGMSDVERLETMAKVIRADRVCNQMELKSKMLQFGYDTTQSSVSRDLKKLGVVKVDGSYKAPNIALGESTKVDRLDASLAGDHMIVLKTGPGFATRAAVLLDGADIAGLLGTVAGDDTIFCAVGSKQDQGKVLKSIFSFFGAD